MPDSSSSVRILSSLPLQVLIYFNRWFAVLYFILNCLIFIYKGWWARVRADASAVLGVVMPGAAASPRRCALTVPTLSIFAGAYFPYPPQTIGWEVAFIFAYAAVEAARLFQG